MADTKKQLARYRIINECLTNKGHMPSTSHNPADMGCWTIKELIDAIYEKTDGEISVSERTIKDDLARMKEDPDLKYFAPIKNKRGVGYYYSDPDYDFTDLPLSPANIDTINEMIGIIRQFKGFKYFENAEGLIYYLEKQVNKSDFKNVQFDVLPDYSGTKHIDPLKKAINNKKVVKIIYQPFYEEAETIFHIHPYLLKEYNNRWFVYAYTNEYGSEGVYALDRIKKVTVTKEPYREPDIQKIIDYFRDIIGVTNYKDKKVETVVLKVSRERANYLITKPVHRSQKVIEENEKYVWFEFKLKPNNELNALILSFGKDMVVEKPASLAREIKSLLQKAYENYSGT
jgi:predicted DNA-binding transcriptional regulator YafY